MNRSFRLALTLTDLVICIGMIALMVGLSLRVIHKMGSRSDEVHCGSNLRQIGMGILMYANDNRGQYPRTRWDMQNSATTQYTGATATNPFADNGPQPNDLTAPAYLVLRNQDLTGEVFVCPGTAGTPSSSPPIASSNFVGEQNLGYSFANMYPSTTAVAGGFRWNNTLGADFAVAADMNAGAPILLTVTPTSSTSDLEKANSQNHRGYGQNVLYGDGHVEWAISPFVGVSRDNIYTVSADSTGQSTASKSISGSPTWRGDSVLLPVATIAPGSRGIFGSNTMLIFIIGGVVLLVAMGLLMFFLMRKKPAIAGVEMDAPAGYAPPPPAPGAAQPSRRPPPLPPQQHH